MGPCSFSAIEAPSEMISDQGSLLSNCLLTSYHYLICIAHTGISSSCFKFYLVLKLLRFSFTHLFSHFRCGCEGGGPRTWRWLSPCCWPEPRLATPRSLNVRKVGIVFYISSVVFSRLTTLSSKTQLGIFIFLIKLICGDSNKMSFSSF